MNISDQQLWDVLRDKMRIFRSATGDDARGAALERLMEHALAQWGLDASAENMVRMRDIFINREYGMTL